MYRSKFNSNNQQQEYCSPKKELFMAMKDQTDAIPVSNYDDTRYYERKHVNTLPQPRSARHKGINLQQQEVPRTRVKFEPKIERPNGYKKEVPRRKEYYQQTTSATSESEYESILECQYLDDNSEHESLFDPNNDYGSALNEMESKMNATTNQYFRKIKSQLSETCSKLKLNQKHNKQRGKCDARAAGDFKNHPKGDAVIERIMKLKTDCYKKIDQNLKILQQIDQVNDQLYKNYIASSSKIN